MSSASPETGAGEVDSARTPPRVRCPVEEPEEGPGPAELVRAALVRARRLAADPLLWVSLLVVAAAVAARAYVLAHSYFVEDDFLFFGAAHAADLTPEFLFSLHKGHFMPGAMFLVYLQTAFLPYAWWFSAGSVLVLQTAAFLVFLRLLWELFGRRWSLLVPLALYVLSPLTVPVLGWWAAALNAVPLQLAMGLALLWTVRHLRTGEQRYAWQAGGAVVFGMLFSVKALFLPPLLFAAAVAFLYPGGLLTAATAAFRLHRPLWSAMAGLTAGYLVLYLMRETAGGDPEGAALPRWDTAVELVRLMLTEAFPVGALGGPYEWPLVAPTGGLMDPSGTVVLGAWAALTALVLVSLGRRARAWRAWALLTGYLVFADALPTVIARGRDQGMAGADARYVADAAMVFALCLAFAFLVVLEQRAREHVGRAGEEAPSPPGRSRSRRRLRTAAVAGLALAHAAGALYSTHTYARTLNGEELRAYLDNVRASLADVPEGGLYPRPVPEDVVLEWNGERRLTSYVLPPLADGETAERLRVPEQAAAAYVFDEEGHLVPGVHTEFSSIVVPGPDDECLGTLEGAVSWPVLEVGGAEQVATVGYVSEEESEIVVSVDGGWIEAALPAAPEGAFRHIPVAERGNRLSLFLDEEAVCLTGVALGRLAPGDEDTPPIPQD
ncbi:hypothetical protein ACOALZ_16670 [Nocardiopsis algeriensis]|uniref:hypothetical protein n=1 Tax=Nocardiopsis algeriensis TaxID=1478215 RepID=UPI003B43D4DD